MQSNVCLPNKIYFNMYKNNLKIVFAFVGTFIGAGFASGKEIAVFFGGQNIAMPILSSIICGGLAYVFLELGRITNGDLLKHLFPKTNKIWAYVFCCANFVIFSAMLAGAEYNIKTSLGIAGGSIISGLLAAAIVLGGIEKLKLANLFAVPLIIFMCILMFVLEPKLDVYGSVSVVSPVLYATMNILSCGMLASRLSSGGTKKQSLVCAIMITLILMLLITLVYLLVKNNAGASMPLYNLAVSLNLSFVGSSLIYLAIITTMIGSLSLASENKPLATIILVAAGLAVSLFGFETIVDTAYPALGVLGVGVSIVAVVRLLLHNKNRRAFVLKQKTKGGIIW